MTTAPSTTSTSASPVSADIVDELASTFRATAESVVPWFVSQMPPMYFQDTDRASQLAHLRAIIGLRNRLVHGYFAIEWIRIVSVVEGDIDALVRDLQTRAH